MRRVWVIALSLLALSACGADGEPDQPQPTEGTEVVPVTGNARDGMTVDISAARGYGTVRVGQGPVAITIGY